MWGSAQSQKLFPFYRSLTREDIITLKIITSLLLPEHFNFIRNRIIGSNSWFFHSFHESERLLPECPSYFCHRFGLRHRSLRFQITHVGGGPVQSIQSSFPPISLASFTCINFTEAEGDFRQYFLPVLLLKTLKWCIYMQPDRQTDYEVTAYSYRERFLFPNIQLDRQRFHDVQLHTAFSRYATRDSVLTIKGYKDLCANGI